MPKPQEVAVLVVNGQQFQDWESVTVIHRWAEEFQIFEFTATEKLPLLNQFLPGEPCQIYLAGILALTGYISIREVAEDKENHSVRLIGRTLTWQLGKSSVQPANLNLDGYDLVAVATKIAGDLGITTKVIGDVDGTPFKQCQAQPGQLCWEHLELLARNRATIMGSDENGQLLLIGPHDDQVVGSFIEGENIERYSFVMSDDLLNQKYYAMAQQPGDDQNWGKSVSEMLAMAPGTDPRASVFVTPVEHPDTPAMVAKRAEFEALLHQGTQIEATVGVQGWLNNSGGWDLWRAGSAYWVRAPSMPCDMGLKAKTVTFKQNEQEGTTTTLELVLPWFLNGRLLSAGAPAAPGKGNVLGSFQGG